MIYYKKFKTIRSILILLVFIGFTANLMAQKKRQRNKTVQHQINETVQGVDLKVQNESGIILTDVQLVIGESEAFIQPDESGLFNFTALPSASVKVSAKGYETRILTIKSIVGKSTLTLKKLRLFATSDDLISLPYLTISKRHTTGGDVLIKGEQLERYQGTDLRNAFTGLAAGLEVREVNGSPGVNVMEKYTSGAEKIDIQLRGRTPIFIIDGIPTEITDMPLDPSEIEDVTIVKDIVSKAMYGPAGADGIVYISTKRGKSNERQINVNFEKGVSSVDRMPTWTNGSDYARLNNIARTNSGMSPLYSDVAISNYEVNDGYNLFQPNNNFRSMMFKNTMNYNRANISTSGGNDRVHYFSYLGYSGESDLFKIGSAANYNRLVSRANLDIKITDDLKVKFGIYGAISLNNSPNYTDGKALQTFDKAFQEANTTPPVEFPVYANNSADLEKPWYGVTSKFGSNPIGGLVGKGFFYETGRTGATNIAFDYDLSKLIKGLSSETYVGFNVFNQVRLGKVEDYAAYTVKNDTTQAGTDPILFPSGRDTTILTKVHDGVDQADLSKLTDFYYQRFVVYEKLKHEMNIGKTNIQNTLIYSAIKVSRAGLEESQRQQNGIWSGLFNYDDKYTLHAVVNIAGTYSFVKEKRFKAFPSLGASWIISEESFMKSVNFIDFLKIRAEAGILGYDNYQAPYFYRDDYGTSTSGLTFGVYPTNTWFGTSTESSVPRTTQNRAGNPDLGWEKRQEINVGLDGLLFNGKLNFEFTYFNSLRKDIISQVSSIIPDVVGLNVLPKLNYNSIRYNGFEANIRYSDKIGNFQYAIGGNATVQDAKNVKIDELNYLYDYQSRLGKSIDSYYGLKYIGQFKTDAEALEVPQLYDDVLHAGDLKYKDMNGDGVVDDNDKTSLGNTTPRLIYALNVMLKYKSFELNLIGTGRAFYDIALTNSYFMNGWGDGNYSSFVEDNIGTSYPKLTYNKVNNNFVGSDFWLTKGDFFKIQNIELKYNFPANLLKSIGIHGASVFVKGTNLYTLTKVKYVDPESIDSGVTSYPLFTNITSGFKLSF